jgi:hypothetical protein
VAAGDVTGAGTRRGDRHGGMNAGVATEAHGAVMGRVVGDGDRAGEAASRTRQASQLVERHQADAGVSLRARSTGRPSRPWGAHVALGSHRASRARWTGRVRRSHHARRTGLVPGDGGRLERPRRGDAAGEVAGLGRIDGAKDPGRVVHAAVDDLSRVGDRRHGNRSPRTAAVTATVATIATTSARRGRAVRAELAPRPGVREPRPTSRAMTITSRVGCRSLCAPRLGDHLIPFASSAALGAPVRTARPEPRGSEALYRRNLQRTLDRPGKSEDAPLRLIRWASA